MLIETPDIHTPDNPETNTPLQLEQRFHPPKNWQWEYVTNANGHKLRIGHVVPNYKGIKAIVVILPGLGEFAEKYFELAHNLLGENYAVVTFDWVCQGKSSRLIKNSQKRHSLGFHHEADDLHCLIKYMNTHFPLDLPKVMLAHSMGANIGLRYIIKHPDVFSAYVASAPMFGIKVLSHLPLATYYMIARSVCRYRSESYVPGGHDWDDTIHPDNIEDSILSSDPARNVLNNIWPKKNPALQTGNVTWGWVRAAIKSCMVLRKTDTLENIYTPSLLFSCGEEKLVSNRAIFRASKFMPNAHQVHIPDAKHEIIMERDELRRVFIDELFNFLYSAT